MKSFFALVLAAAMLASPAHAQENISIAAVVNDEAVSTLDIENRLKMVLATTQLSDTPEVRERLKPQILRALVMERLQEQEAAANNISVDAQEVEDAIASIEQQRGMPSGSLLERLDGMGVPRESFQDQIRAQLAWTKLIVRKLKPLVKVSEEELDRERAKQKGAGGAAEVQIEVLSLPVDKPESDAQVKALAEKLVSEIRGGARFESVAGELGGGQPVAPFWTPLSALDPVLAASVGNAGKGEVSDPVRTLEGYTIVKLLDKRDGAAGAPMVTEAVVKDILLKLRFDAGKQDVEASLAVGREVAKTPGDCSSRSVAGISNLKDFDIQVEFHREMLEEMASGLREAVEKLPVGGVSEPYASEDGIRLFMLCERVERPAPLADRDETMARIQQQKLELEAQKYLRRLRREASVELRNP